MFRLGRLVFDQGAWREVSAVWLTFASIIGVLGLYICSLAAVWAYGDWREGLVPTPVFLAWAAAYIYLAAGPVLGWLLHHIGRHWAAMAVTAPTILVGAAPVIGSILT